MYRRYFKRLFDIFISILALPFFALLIFIIAPIIYISDKGSIFYNSNRLGKNGKIFKMYKFRTMKMHAPDIRNADGSTYNSEKDIRLTRIGRFLRKTSIDEIPQIINVLLGDMSIIGPRPDLPEHINLYDDFDILKLQIKPGITGLNQAYYRNAIPWKERIKHDIEYSRKISFILDLKIILRTLIVIFKSDNIFIKQKAVDKDDK